VLWGACYLILLTDIVGCFMVIVVVKFIQNHCGDFIARSEADLRDQWAVEMEAATSFALDDDFQVGSWLSLGGKKAAQATTKRKNGKGDSKEGDTGQASPDSEATQESKPQEPHEPPCSDDEGNPTPETGGNAGDGGGGFGALFGWGGGSTTSA